MASKKLQVKKDSPELQLGKVLFARQVTGDVFNLLNELSTFISQGGSVEESEAFKAIPELLNNLIERIEDLG